MRKDTEKLPDSPLKYSQPAIFMDADGTLWPDKGPGSIFQDIDLVGLASQIRNLCYVTSIERVFVVSNQTCVARGLCTLNELRERIREIEVSVRKLGVSFDFRYCVHHPNALDALYRVKCDCRKPSPKIIMDISDKFSIDLRSSIFVGDRITDAQSASYAGVKHIFLIHNEKMFESNIYSLNPDYDHRLISFRITPSITYLVDSIRMSRK